MSAEAGLIAILVLFPVYLVYTGKLGIYAALVSATPVAA